MNRNQLLILLAAGLLLGGVGLYVSRQKSESFARTAKIAGDKLLGDFPVNDVAQITVRQGTNEVNLAKADVWAVKERNNYPANAAEIIELARKLWDLRAAQSQKIGESQLARLDLLAPGKATTNSATLVELKAKDGKTLRSVLLGKQSMRGGGGNDQFGGGGWPNGRWIYLPDKPGTAWLVSETFSEIQPTPEHWLSKDFFRIEKPRSIAVTYADAGTNSWKLTRETESGDWKLTDARPDEQLDSSQVSGVSSPFSSPSFQDLAFGNASLEKPTVIEVGTFDGFNYTVKAGAKTNDSFPLTVAVAATLPKERAPAKDEKPEDKDKLDKEFKDKQKKLEEKLTQEKSFEKWTYLVSSWTVDSLLKERSQLLAKKAEPGKAESEKVDSDEKPEEEKPPGETPAPEKAAE